MNIPITGILLIPLGLVLIFLPWRYCLIALTTFATLSAAAVVNVGHFGLQPGYYFGILITGRTCFEIMLGRFKLNGYVLARMAPLFCFMIICFLVLFIALCFFQGQVQVLPGTDGFKSALTHPFHLARNNFTQIAYLIINTSIIYCVGHQGGKRPADELIRDWDRALACGLCFAAFVCFWQFSSFYAGVPFSTDFFYSNAGYNRADSQSMAGLFRINGPFEEPSALGFNFTGYLLFAWMRYRRYPTAFSIGMVAAALFCMVVSTSTLAFVGIFIFCCVLAYDVLASRIHLLTKDFKFSSGQVAAIALIVVGILGTSIFVAGHYSEIHVILQKTLFQKSQSTSFQQRSFADILAMHIFVETHGIGVGLGSHKANSLVLTLLSNTGLVGTVVFAAFVISLVRPIRVPPGRYVPDKLFESTRPFQWMVLGLGAAHAVANPNLSTPAIWLAMAGVLAIQAALRRGLVALPSKVKRRNRLSRIHTAIGHVHRTDNAGHPLAS